MWSMFASTCAGIAVLAVVMHRFYEAPQAGYSHARNSTSLQEILLKEQQRGRHFASLLIVRVGQTSYAWERKTSDYPIQAFANCLSLLGGNPEGSETPHQALVRELVEELPTSLAIRLGEQAVKFGEFEVETGPPILPQPNYFTAHIWHVNVPENGFHAGGQIPGEGRAVIVNDSELEHDLFCWGYHLVWRTYVRNILGRPDFQMPLVSGVKVLDLRSQQYL